MADNEPNIMINDQTFINDQSLLTHSSILDTIDMSGIMNMATDLLKNLNIDTLYKKIDTKIIHSQFINPDNIDNQQKLMEDIEALPDPEKLYICTEKKVMCKGSSMNKLHKWVLMTKEYPFLEDKIKEYCQSHPEDIDKFTEDRSFTPLMLATLNLDSVCTFRTIQILLEAGANPNIECPDDQETVLTIISDKTKLARFDLYKILLDYGANVTHSKNTNFSKSIIENFISCCSIDNQEMEQIIDLFIDHGVDISIFKDRHVLVKYYYLKINELQRENESLKQYIKMHHDDPMTIQI